MANKVTGMLLAGMICAGWATMAFAAEETSDSPWETYGFSAGYFISNLNTTFRIGSAVALDVDVEEFLDLDSSNNVFRVGGLWRFSDNQRHRLDLSWFGYRRSGSKIINEDIEIEDRDGDPITVLAGTEVDAFFNIDLYQLKYGYSFLQDDRLDIALDVGLYVMPIEYGITVSGTLENEGQQDFIAPLPTLGLRLDIALAPKWYLRSGSHYFYLKYDRFRGSLITGYTALEYKPWQHVGIGLGFDSFRLGVEAEGEDYPSIDFRGNIDFEYVGAQLYVRYFF
ncbi:MAG: hypothetical protein PVI89_15585 [Desulfobacteraceae bacterium]